MVRGRVRDADGRGVPGVEVEAVPRAAPQLAWEPAPRDDEERLRQDIRRVVARHRWSVDARRTAVTGADGSYVLTGLSDVSYDLVARADGWHLRGDSFQWVSPGDVADFEATRTAALPVAVLLPDGSPADSGRLQFADSEAECAAASHWTRPWQGEPLDLEPDTYWIRALGGDFDEYASPFERVVVDPATAAAPLVLRLRERPGVEVAVGTDPDGPLAVLVSLLPAEVEGATRELPSKWVAPGRRWVFTALAPGAYTVVVRLRGQREVHREEVVVRDALVRTSVALAGRGLRDWVPVRVLLPDGSAMPDSVRFTAGVRGADGDDEQCGAAATCVGPGAWRVAQFVGGAAARGAHWIAAQSPRHGLVAADCEPDAAGEVVLRFPPVGRVAVELTGPDVAAETFQVRLEPDGAEPTSALAAHGRAEFDVVPGGPCRVVVLVDTDASDFVPVGGTQIDVVPGPNAVVVTVPPLQRLLASADDPDCSLDLERLEAGGRWLDVDECDRPEERDDVVCAWKALAPGRYRLRSEDGEMRLVLPCRPEVRFEPRPYDALRLYVDEDDVVHAAGLRDGDVAVAIDGEELTSRRHIDALLARARHRERARLTVLRGAARLDADLDLAALEDLGWDYAVR